MPYRTASLPFWSVLKGSLPASQITSHVALLKIVRNRTASARTPLDETVRWNGEQLTPQVACELAATACAVRVGDGYLCGALDGLLAATCAAFHVSIAHNFVGETHTYDVARPLRIIHLQSSKGHMRHVKNVDMS